VGAELVASGGPGLPILRAQEAALPILPPLAVGGEGGGGEEGAAVAALSAAQAASLAAPEQLPDEISLGMEEVGLPERPLLQEGWRRVVKQFKVLYAHRDGRVQFYPIPVFIPPRISENREGEGECFVVYNPLGGRNVR
jgi:hypothetical protein